MKKSVYAILAAMLILSLSACRKIETPAAPVTEPVETSRPMEVPAEPEEPEETAAAEAGESIDLTGPWHLDGEKNDLAAFSGAYPEYDELGAGMEIRSNGLLSWHIGAVGGAGTYTQDGGALAADLTSTVDEQPMEVTFRVLAEDETASLEMSYNGMTVYWAYGDNGDEPAAAEEAVTGAEPEYGGETVSAEDSEDEEIADPYPGEDVVELVNLRGDETTVYKLADGTYMDRIERVFVFDGVETWTDEEGVEWNAQIK